MSNWAWDSVETKLPPEKFIALWNQRGKLLQQAVNEKQREHTVDLRKFGADPTGARDSTTAIQTAIKAAPAGTSFLMTTGTYKITGDINLSKVGQKLLMDGVTLNSTAGRLVAGANNTLIDGMEGTTFNFVSGDPALSLDHAMTASGSYNGSLLPITGTIAAGDTSFVATNASDIDGMVADDWVIVGEFTSDWQRIEWKQVESVAGTTVTVTTPFRRTINTYTPLKFYRVTPIEDATFRGVYVVTTSTASDNIGAYLQLSRNCKVEKCRFEIARGLGFFTYMGDSPSITANVIDNQGGRASAISAVTDGHVSFNRFNARGGLPAHQALTVETGTAWTTFDSNVCVGSGGSGVIGGQWVDFNKFVNNTINSDGASVGIMILGGDGNTTQNNHCFNVLEGVRFDTETVTSPTRTSNGNTSIGDKVRTATRGVNLGHGVGNAVYMLDVDSSVTTPVLDSGTLSTQVYKDPATGFIILTPSSLPAQIGLAGAPNDITQLKLGTSSAWSSVGTRFSGTDLVFAHNANQSSTGDLWHQNSAGIASKLLVLRTNGNLEFYSAAAGTADGTFATFWGTPSAALVAGGRLNLNGTQVVSTRVTGYTAMTGSPDKATAYATGTITLAQLAGRVAQIQADLTSHGLIGP